MNIKQDIYMVVAVIAMLGAQAAFADVTVVYAMTLPEGNAAQTIRYVDKQHVRVDMTNSNVNREMTMMKLGDSVYAIIGKTVQDMNQLSSMMAAMGKGGVKHSNHAPIVYEDTGKTETIAGIEGKVYRFVERGKQHEVVLGHNSDLQAAVLGVVEINKAVAGTGMMPSGTEGQVQEDISVRNMAMLRLDDTVRLQSMNTDNIQDSEFVLPAKPQGFGGAGMGGIPGGMRGK